MLAIFYVQGRILAMTKVLHLELSRRRASFGESTLKLSAVGTDLLF